MATDTEISKALTLHRSGRLAEAESLYRSILNVHSDHPGALHLLALVEISKQDYDSAVRLIQRSIESGGPNAVRLNDLGSACRAAGDLNKAADAFRSALNLKRDLTPAWLGLAGVLREQGRLSDAIDTLEEGKKLVSREASLDFNLATLLAESGDYEQAAIRFGVLLDDDPGQIAASLVWAKYSATRQTWTRPRPYSGAPSNQPRAMPICLMPSLKSGSKAVSWTAQRDC
jgi:tetratricopeptide (TPR) repeat protein